MARPRRNPAEVPFGEWVPTHAVRFNANGTVDLMTEPGQPNPSSAGLEPDAIDDDFEYWVIGGEVYRNVIGQRGYITTQGYPSGIRWESSLSHWNHFHPQMQLSERRWKKNPARRRRRR